MTEKLYYSDSHCRAFRACVLDCREQEDGKWAVLLDRSAFSPAAADRRPTAADSPAWLSAA